MRALLALGFDLPPVWLADAMTTPSLSLSAGRSLVQRSSALVVRADAVVSERAPGLYLAGRAGFLAFARSGPHSPLKPSVCFRDVQKPENDAAVDANKRSFLRK